MHSEIKAYYEKLGYKILEYWHYDCYYAAADQNSSLTVAIYWTNSKTTEYIEFGDKHISEEKMLRLIKLKAFL